MIWPLLIGILIIIFTVYALHRATERFPLKFLLTLLSLKIVFGLFIAAFYMIIQEGRGDSIHFFNICENILAEGYSGIQRLYFNEMPELLFDTTRSELFVKLLLPIVFISGGNYWLTTLLISCLSFLVILTVLLRYNELVIKNIAFAALSFMAFPSLLLWTSGVFKESFAFIFLLFALIPLLDLYLIEKRKMDWMFVVIAFMAFFLLLKMRYFLAFTLVPVYGILLIKLFERKKAISLTVVIALIFLAFLSLHPVLNPAALPEFLYRSHQDILSHGSSEINMWYSFSTPDWKGIIANLPSAFVNAFIRPFPWEWNNPGLILYSFENLIILFLVISFLIDFRNQRWYIWLLLIVIFISLTFISLATPNFGSLFRYRSIFLPFLALILLRNRLNFSI